MKKGPLRLISFGSLAVIIVAMVAATFVEKPRGSDFAFSLVYYNPAFIALWGVAAVSALMLLFSSSGKAFFTKLLHCSFAVMLAGALVTHLFSQEGMISLIRGVPNATVITSRGQRIELPFTMTLQEFEIERYPGSMAPSDYRSLVALDDGKISLTDSVFCENGVYTGFGGSRMTDSHKYGWLDVPHIIANSSNIGTSKLIHAAYKDNPQAFVDGVYRTGINTHFGLQLTGTAAPVIRRDGYWDATRLPWMSIGYNTQLPVINTLAFYNGIANGGCMVAPRLVTRVTREGEVVQEFPVEVVRRHMCKDETLAKVKSMLELVVIEGTGKNAGSKHFTVAGKTGTAQLSQGNAGYRNGPRRYMVSFCGYFPADAPQYSCIVSVRTDGGAAGGATWAAPAFHEISEKVMASRNLRDVKEAYDSTFQFIPKVAGGNLVKSAAVLKELGKRNLMSREYRNVSDTVWGWVSSDSGEYVIKPATVRDGLVPDVHGMGASDALYLLESMGMRVSLSGVGRVKSQTPAKNTRFRKGDKIQLTLSM